MLVLYIILLVFSSSVLAQENRSDDLKIDFGSRDENEPFWANWYQLLPEEMLLKDFPFSFGTTGISIELRSLCDTDSECGLATESQDAVTGTDFDYVFYDGLKVFSNNMEIKISGLEEGYYNFELFFVDLQAGDLQFIDVFLSDSKVTEFKVLSRIKPERAYHITEPNRIHVPIFLDNPQDIIIRTHALDVNYLINGIILTQFNQVDLIDEDIELIHKSRYPEAEIVSYDNGIRSYGCAVKLEDENHYFGSQREDESICVYYFDDQVYGSYDYKLIRADPFKGWPPGSVDALPARAFPFTSLFDKDYYICRVDYSATKRLVGTYIPEESTGCRIQDEGQTSIFTDFNVWSHRLLEN